MSKKFEVQGCLKSAERDNFNEGCLPGTGQDSFIECNFSADTVPELVVKLLDFVGAEPGAEELNVCDEDGRIDIQTTENDDGLAPTARQDAAFKRGELDLWACTYSFRVEYVARASIRLEREEPQA